MFSTSALLRSNKKTTADWKCKPAAVLVPIALSACLLTGMSANAQQSTTSGKTSAAAKSTKGAKSGIPSAGSGKSTDKTVGNSKPTAANVAVSAAPTPAQLAYQFTPGATYRYRLAALFDGHFPPFAQPDGPPIHIKVDLVYVATVKKADKTGATVEFKVDNFDLSLFEHEIKENEKIDPDKAATFPIALEDVQKTLNATAVLRPDGSVANILTAGSVKVQIDVGFDLRKLFLLLLPVTLSNQPVKVGDTWQTTDGLLGMKAGRTSYTNKLADAKRKGKAADYTLNQVASSVVEDKLNKEGNSTTDTNDIYRTLTGKIDMNGEMTLATPGGALPGPLFGQVKSAHILMNANVNRKRVKIDPDHPEIPENDPLDVKARMTITRETDKSSVANAGKNPHP